MLKSQEIRHKISSTKKIRKITHAMQVVAAGKRRRAEERMRTSLPYADKISSVIEHIKQSRSEYLHHPYIQKKKKIERIGLLVIASDLGLCGGLNINLFKKILLNLEEWQSQGIATDLFLIGNKAALFFSRLRLKIRTQVVGLTDVPAISDLIGTTTAMRDAYDNGEIDSIFIAYNEFISTVLQKAQVEQLLPLLPIKLEHKKNWDYIYEPNSIVVLKTLLVRYIETKIYQATVSNIACEQVARMMAMQNATDNAGKFIDEMELIYNKARQATITQEIAEIIGGTISE